MKVVTRNNLLRKLSNSKWGANAKTIRTTALALSYSVAEYAAPVWARSSHAQKLNMELNSAGNSKPVVLDQQVIGTRVGELDIGEEHAEPCQIPKQE